MSNPWNTVLCSFMGVWCMYLCIFGFIICTLKCFINWFGLLLWMEYPFISFPICFSSSHTRLGRCTNHYYQNSESPVITKTPSWLPLPLVPINHQPVLHLQNDFIPQGCHVNRNTVFNLYRLDHPLILIPLRLIQADLYPDCNHL